MVDYVKNFEFEKVVVICDQFVVLCECVFGVNVGDYISGGW